MIPLTKIKAFLLLLFALTCMLPSCYYDNEESLYPSIVCDTTNVTYSQTIAPIMAASCNACHSGQNPSAGINTDSRAGLQVVVNDGKLLPAIEHTGPFPMPQGGSKLSDCNIARIQKWVENGAPDN